MSTKYFRPESIEKFNILHQSFNCIETLQGEDFVLKFKLLDGDVFVIHTVATEGSIYNIQWFGQPEAFGFILKPHRGELWGPYHFM